MLIRWIVFLIGLFFLLFGALLLSGIQSETLSWPNSYLLGATLIAYAIATLWIGVMQAFRALVGAGLCGALTFGAIGLFLLRLSHENPETLQAGEFSLFLAIFSLCFLLLGLKVTPKKADRLPLTTQWLFGLVLISALIEGLYLIVALPGHFPWTISAEFAVVYGWILIGSTLFFGWSLLQPTWENGYPLLYALLVYDALLIGPLLSFLRDPADVEINSLYLWFAIIFLAVSGIWTLIELTSRFFTVRKS